MAFNRGLNGVVFPDVCRDCKPPKRNAYCHMECWAYLKAKEEFDKEANAERAARKAAMESEIVAFLLKRG